MPIIRSETPGDIEAIRTVHRQAFGGENEGRLVDLLRDGGFGRSSKEMSDIRRRLLRSDRASFCVTIVPKLSAAFDTRRA